MTDNNDKSRSIREPENNANVEINKITEWAKETKLDLTKEK